MTSKPDLSNLENIFSMMMPVDVIAAKQMGINQGKNSMSSWLSDLILESGNTGCYSVSTLKEKLDEYRKGITSDAENKKKFDLMVNFYSTLGGLSDVTYPYTCPNPEKSKDKPDLGPITNCSNLDTIMGVQSEYRGGRNMSILMSNTPFVSPMVRDARKVEIFLNYLPATVISRCVPYLELEFSFDRNLNSDIINPTALRTAGLLKFLLGGATIETGADRIMFDARASKKDDSIITTAGMELFTSPQTLQNLNNLQPGSRYADVRDPMRPFASLEQVTISVNSTVGLYSYKKATAVIKLHDKSRLSDLADLIQPATYTRTSVWLTYGWRHPYEPAADSRTKTYADFINNNMLMKEAYGLKNVSFSFDAVGQVSINMELFTKSISEMKAIKVTEATADANPQTFASLNKWMEEAAKSIAEIRRRYKLETPSGGVEVRAYSILDAAENGQFPDDAAGVASTLWNLKQFLKKAGGKIPPTEKDQLVSTLENMFSTYKTKEGGKEVVKYAYKNKVSSIGTEIVKKKFNKLSDGYDPFLITEDKWKRMKSEAGFSDGTPHNLLNVIGEYNAKYKPKDAITKDLGIQKKIISFGKLFSVFMGEALFSIESIDEFQVFFYPLNDKCGPASYVNVAEFPIDLPVFLSQYKDFVENKGSEVITIEEFIQLVVNAQFSDQRALGYGFLLQGIFEPYDPKSKDAKLVKITGQAKLDAAMLNMGSFVMPQIEMYVETTHEKFKDFKPVDILRYYESYSSSGDKKLGGDMVKKICRIHIYDKTVNAYKGATHILKSGGAGQGNDTTYVEIEGKDADAWIRAHENIDDVQKIIQAYQDEAKIVVNGVSREKSVQLNASKISTNEDIKRLVSKMIPSLIVGMNATGILEASLSSKQDPLLTSAQLLGHNSTKKPSGMPSGAGMGGLPLRVIPASLTLRTVGCPILNYSQLFFVDLGTGTTLDNVYGISGLTHTISPGKFDSSLTMSFYDAYGKYESAHSKLAGMVPIIEQDGGENKDPKTKANNKAKK